MNIVSITPGQLFQLVSSGSPVEVIDVRTPAEFQELRADVARNVPLDRLNARQFAATERDAGRALYVICRSGNRSRQACEKLLATGVTNVVNVEGGTLAWDRAGLPVVRGEKAISLERQVRIAAGALVLLGLVLASLVSPYLIAISALVGTGLVFAGITDNCGMALFLSRMPWNRIPRASSPSHASGNLKEPAAQKSSCRN